MLCAKDLSPYTVVPRSLPRPPMSTRHRRYIYCCAARGARSGPRRPRLSAASSASCGSLNSAILFGSVCVGTIRQSSVVVRHCISLKCLMIAGASVWCRVRLSPVYNMRTSREDGARNTDAERYDGSSLVFGVLETRAHMRVRHHTAGAALVWRMVQPSGAAWAQDLRVHHKTRCLSDCGPPRQLPGPPQSTGRQDDESIVAIVCNVLAKYNSSDVDV